MEPTRVFISSVAHVGAILSAYRYLRATHDATIVPWIPIALPFASELTPEIVHVLALVSIITCVVYWYGIDQDKGYPFMVSVLFSVIAL